MQLLLVFIALVSASTRPHSYVKTPFGPRMCIQLCGRLGGCVYPVYMKHGMTCHVLEVSRMPLSEGVFKLDMSKVITKAPRNMTDWLMIKTYRGSERYITTLEEKTYSKGRNLSVTDRFSVHPSTKLKKGKCIVLSMDRSTEHPNIMFLLLHCLNFTYCSVRLHFVDLDAKHLKRNKIKFCSAEMRKGNIFMGSCVKNSSEACLFCVSVHLKKLSIRSYKEPTYNTTIMPKPGKFIHYGFLYETCICSVYKPRSLICFAQAPGADRLYNFSLNTGTRNINMGKLYLQYEHFIGIKDFKIDRLAVNIRRNPIALVVCNNSINVISIDFIKKTINKVNSAAITAETATISHGYIWVHGQKLEDPFYII